jgi:transposase
MDTPAPPLASIGIDIGKEVFPLVGFGADRTIAFRRKIKRLALVETFKKLPPYIVGDPLPEKSLILNWTIPR